MLSGRFDIHASAFIVRVYICCNLTVKVRESKITTRRALQVYSFGDVSSKFVNPRGSKFNIKVMLSKFIKGKSFD